MIRKLLLSLSGAAAATVLAVSFAQAAPAVGTLEKLGGVNQSTLEQVHWRRYHRCHRHCWWHHGHYHCRRVCNW